MKLSETDKHYFKACAQQILETGKLYKLDSFTQHRGTSRLDHSISVAYHSYRISISLGLHVDLRSMIRGAVLHDFFLYDWREETGRKGVFINLFTHPREALRMSQRNFELNIKERDIILKHMWPLTVVPPKSKEAFIVCMMDKYCAVKEMFRRRNRFVLETVKA